MATSKLNLYSLDIGSTGWDNQIDSNTETIDDEFPTKLIMTCGEEVDPTEAVYIKSDGLIWLAQADGTKQDAIGLMFESGVTSDVKRVQTLGLITTTGWSWTAGQNIYLDPFTPGAITNAAPATTAYVQKIGIAVSSISIFIGSI
jgi:hypothetical protein